MAQVYVKYNPYRMKTEIRVNGNELTNDSVLQHIKGKRLQEWIGEFPRLLIEVLNTRTFEFEFHGMSLDWDDFHEVITKAEKVGTIQVGVLRFKEVPRATTSTQRLWKSLPRCRTARWTISATRSCRKHFRILIVRCSLSILSEP